MNVPKQAQPIHRQVTSSKATALGITPSACICNTTCAPVVGCHTVCVCAS